MDLISIITPMYNGAKYVSYTIDSVLAQTYSNWEMIIVDDGSKDNGAELVQTYSEKDGRIKLFRQANGGSSVARNNGLKNAKGRYICFWILMICGNLIFWRSKSYLLKQNKQK